LAVLYPVKNCWWKETNATYIICIIWILSFITASPLLYYTRAVPFNYSGFALYDCREEWEGELKSKIYTVILFITTFMIPFISLCFLYGSIGIKILKKIKPGETQNYMERIRTRRKIKVYFRMKIVLMNFSSE
jgi:predicted membrane protein